MTEKTTAEQAALLRRGTQAIVPENGLEAKLATSRETGRPLRIKLGLDPTAPDIHLGFAVVLRKLRQFQDLGHKVIIILGDYTALIGDPSGRSSTRPMLTQEQIHANAETYVDQLAVILDRSKTRVRFNSEWLGKLDFAEIVRLASKITVARVLERDDFAKRYKEHQPISLHELLYPLAQAYDSVAIEADVEMGGLDQTFNILTGRDLQREEGQEPQVALFMPLLVGLDGVKKMSKSLGNYVGITESPDVMFAKLMSISDEAMPAYFELCSDDPMEAVNYLFSADVKWESLSEESRAWLEAESLRDRNPMSAKRRLGRAVVTIYHDKEAAHKADAEWQRVHSRHELPGDIPESAVPEGESVWVCKLLVHAGFAKSNGEARRLVEQGGVTLDGEKLTNAQAELPIAGLHGKVIKVGAKRYVRLVAGD